MLLGHQTWSFENTPVILSTGIVGGPFESQGNIVNDYDVLHDDMWIKQTSFEKAQQIMMEEASDIALKKVNMETGQVQFFISGDLINQITPSTFAARTIGVPYFGLFSACATSMEGLALAAMIVNGNGANYILTGASSHNASAERQFRNPTEYGGQKPPTSQWTVTGAGCALVAKEGDGPLITSATVGKIVDLGMTDPNNMGAAMAPAAADTIMTHLKERNIDSSYYDLIITGDLGRLGRKLSLDLLNKNGLNIKEDQYADSGIIIYKEEQPVFSGGSGPASSAVVMYGHIINLMKKGVLNRVLLVATGSLHSPMSVQQGDTIPGIAHAVSIESGRDIT